MDEYSLKKSRGKNRGDKSRNKTKKLYTRAKHHGDAYDEGDQFKITRHGKTVEDANYEREFPGYCRECDSSVCKHAIQTRINLIWLGYFSVGNIFSTLPKDIIRVIAECTRDHSQFQLHKSSQIEGIDSGFMNRWQHVIVYGTPCQKKTRPKPSRNSKKASRQNNDMLASG
tara:strand:+ start:38456 stop:38968 length:513 start_codon:yes stop_codon:yes gene_type:complete